MAGNDVGREFYLSRGFEHVGTPEFEVGGEASPSVVYALAL